MRLIVSAVLLGSLVVSSPVFAKDPSNSPPAQNTNVLRQGLEAAMNAAAQPPGQSKRPFNSQGAEHASLRALEVVCNKDTPAAQRSAICRPNSPF